MHVYFVGIGGSGIGPLSLIAHQAGFKVSGSNDNGNETTEKLRELGIKAIAEIQDGTFVKSQNDMEPIDWVVRSSAIPDDNEDIAAAQQLGIPVTKRDEFINELLKKTDQKMIAIAGTHGKTSTTAMVIWLFKQLNIPLSYSVGAKMSFGSPGEFNEQSEFFIYEADEYDRNFLQFKPEMSIIAGVDYDHPDIYPTREDYYAAFKQFIDQSTRLVMWEEDASKLGIIEDEQHTVLNTDTDLNHFELTGKVMRKNAHAAVVALQKLGLSDYETLRDLVNQFPGLSRRFEEIAPNIYSDYAHTPEKIRGAIDMALEVNENVTVVYEGLHNTRQHFIKDELPRLFEKASSLYIVPSYLAREDESLELLTPNKLNALIERPLNHHASDLSTHLEQTIADHARDGDLVLCLTAGAANSLDEWLRKKFVV